MPLLTDPWGQPVRESDPNTSHEAAREIRWTAGSQRHALLFAFYMAWMRDELGALTSEAAFLLAKQYGMNVSATSYWKRVSELHQMGLITYAGEDHTTRAGKKAQAYNITQHGIDELASIERQKPATHSVD